MSIDNTTAEWREETSNAIREAKGAIRRMGIKLTSGVFWQTLGHLLLDGVTREVRDAEVFSGIGFYARPKAGHKTDAIVVFPGGSSNPIIIATRDEDARKVVANLAADETAMFNSATVIIVKANGTVEIRAAGGTAQALATKADVESVDQKYANHVHVAAGTSTSIPLTSYVPGPPPITVLLSPATIVGTTVLKGQ